MNSRAAISRKELRGVGKIEQRIDILLRQIETEILKGISKRFT